MNKFLPILAAACVMTSLAGIHTAAAFEAFDPSQVRMLPDNPYQRGEALTTPTPGRDANATTIENFDPSVVRMLPSNPYQRSPALASEPAPRS